jgi:endo-1,3(4)-beta-glucanase
MSKKMGMLTGGIASLCVATGLLSFNVVDVASTGKKSTRPAATTTTRAPVKTQPPAAQVVRAVAPVINGVTLEDPTGARPPEPAGWAGHGGAVPTNNFWAPLATGNGAAGVWPVPLFARISTDGRVSIGSGTRVDQPEGTRMPNAPVTVIAELGPSARPAVTDAGSFHVRWRQGSTSITLVQGSPFVEFEGTSTLNLVIPGISGMTPGPVTKQHPLARGVTLGTATGRWVFAASVGSTVSINGDNVAIAFTTPSGRFVAGPLPQGVSASYSTYPATLVASPLVDTVEQLSVAEDGTVEQQLRQVRSGSPMVPWTLARHQIGALSSRSTQLGLLPSVDADRPVVAAQQLTLRFSAVPLLWSVVAIDGAGQQVSTQPTVGPPPPLSDISRGSYFGGKGVATAALSGMLTGEPGDLAAHSDTMIALLRALEAPQQPPDVAWESRWGKMVIEPAEFGSLEALNDHHLQYGYWVLAASIAVERDPSVRAWIGGLIDALIVDFGGAGPNTTTTDRHGAWSPFDGHSWASGITDFADGNNLESPSESSAAWWAAARWYLATGRPELAERFIAMLTIESHVTGVDWLPDTQRPNGVRPWSGVVWSAKVDNNTWFDPAPESALGIRLLPIGPMSVSRYHDGVAIDAARRRWEWCGANGGCTTRWANLLDSDAAVAGLSQRTGPDPEPSVTDAMAGWWRSLWSVSSAQFDVQCSPGVVARSLTSGGTVLLISNPSAEPRAVKCWQKGVVRWSGVAAPRSATAQRLA